MSLMQRMWAPRSEEHTSELQSQFHLVCRLLLEKKNSRSVGFLIAPPAMAERLNLAVSLARAARHPALEALLYFGPQPGTFPLEFGNAGREPEHALGVDMSMRWRHARASGEVTDYRNDISRFVFRRPLNFDELEDRLYEFDDFFFNDTATTEIYTLSLHDALPI